MARKVAYLPSRLLKGREGSPGKEGETRIIREIVEVPVNMEPVLSEVAALKTIVKKLEKRRPEAVQHGGGGFAVTQYLHTSEAVSHWRKASFVQGINVIGVRYSGPATVYLPHDLDPQQLISVKDEVGSGNVTILIE